MFIGHLHSGNVLVCDIENIKLTGIENSTLGLPAYYRSFLVQLGKKRIQNLNDADIYGFGHILYELTENEPLTRPYCEHFSQKTSLNLSEITFIYFINNYYNFGCNVMKYLFALIFVQNVSE